MLQIQRHKLNTSIKEATGISQSVIRGLHASHRLSEVCVKLQDSQTGIDLDVVPLLLTGFVLRA